MHSLSMNKPKLNPKGVSKPKSKSTKFTKVNSKKINKKAFTTLKLQPILSSSSLTTISKRTFTTKHIQKYKSLPPRVHFDDSIIAYQTKSTPQLLFTDSIFSLCRIPSLVQHAPFLIRTTRKILGDKTLEFMLRKTFYKHFCVGANETEVIPTLTTITTEGIGGILDWGAEPEDDELAGSDNNNNDDTATTQHNDQQHISTTQQSSSQQQHGHSHNGVQCNHNHNSPQENVETTINQHLKAHEDLHNVFNFTSNKQQPSETIIGTPIIIDQSKSTTTTTTSSPSSSTTTTTPSSSTKSTTIQPTPSLSTRRYTIKEEKTFDHETTIFKRSIDTASSTRAHLTTILSTPSLRSNYTTEQLANIEKVLDEPSFIAIKITALSSIQFLSRASTLINLHTYMWDILTKKPKATVYHQQGKLNDDIAPTDDEFINSTPSFINDQFDTLTRNDFTTQLIEYYNLTIDDANELFNFCTTDRNKNIISRHDWQSNMNLHHILSLGNKLYQHKIPSKPINANELLFAYPDVSNAPMDGDSNTNNNGDIITTRNINIIGGIKKCNTLIDREDIDHLNKVMARLDQICAYARDKNVSIFVDAEQFYYQQAIDHITMDLMATYNTPMPNDYYTHLPNIEKNNMKKITTTTTTIPTTSTTPTSSTTTTEIPQTLLAAKKWHHDYDLSAMESPTPLLFPSLTTPTTTESTPTTPIRHPVVWHTYQCYLKDTLYRLRRDFNLAQDHNFTFACKIVRGAYITAETLHSTQNGYTNPLQENIENTHENYNKAMLFLLSQRNLNSSNVAHVLIASHNQETFEIATNYLEEELDVAHNVLQQQEQSTSSTTTTTSSTTTTSKKLKTIPRHKLRVYFAQLYGMGQRLTYPLASKGYGAFNYLTYGPPIMCLPYLLRRAQENGSLLGGTVVESKLLKKEIKRRIFSFDKK